jgi:Sigma-70, region 4
VSSSLSPILYLFLAPAGILYLKVQQLLTHGETHDADPPPIVSKRRPGPKQPKYGIPPEHWLIIMQRVVESKKSLRAIAQEYGVSHETIRRIILHGQQA